jgi:hypothetical protein
MSFRRVSPLLLDPISAIPCSNSVIPSQPIKAFEFSMSFNPSLFQAHVVKEGDIFDDYTTFFNAGTINNKFGTIVKVYGLIVGSGNVSHTGSFVSISFTAKVDTETSSFDISGIGVTNELGYIPISVYDGVITSPEIPEPNGDSEPNTPPNTPLKPSGPIYVEVGVTYIYTSSTKDKDGNQVRYKFDWGDGNISKWSAFVDSNVSFSMSHLWNSTSSYGIRVIAQDENGSESGWSTPLNVTVLQFDFLGVPPIADFEVPSSIFVNQTIMFNAYNSCDEDSIIISYFWDFGDGENGSGVCPLHTYTYPGEFTVSLIVTDYNGNMNQKSLVVQVHIETVEKESTRDSGGVPFDFGQILVGLILLCICIVFIFTRDYLKTIVTLLIKKSRIPLQWKLWMTRMRINRITDKIKKIENIYLPNINSNKIKNIDMAKSFNGAQIDYYRALRHINKTYNDGLYEENDSEDNHNQDKNEQIDKCTNMKLKNNKIEIKNSDFRTIIDIQQFFDRKRNRNKCDGKQEHIIFDLNTLNIERTIDNWKEKKNNKNE